MRPGRRRADGVNLAPATVRAYRSFASVKLTPRHKLAIRLHASTACRTLKEAAEATGLSVVDLRQVMKMNPEAQKLHAEVVDQVADRAVGMGEVMQLLARKAALVTNDLLDSNNEHIKAKVAADVLDRSPETSKTLKHQVTQFNLDGTDARELAASLVAAARVGQRFEGIEDGDFVKVDHTPAGARLEGSSIAVAVQKVPTPVEKSPNGSAPASTPAQRLAAKLKEQRNAASAI